MRDQYALAYSRDRGIPSWVSWHLEAADLGAAPRYSGPFITDTALPTGWHQVKHADYTGSGYDRGHVTPSADRSASDADNEATFILSNVLPQAPENSQGLWAQLEEHARDLVGQGDELYIISGGAGSLGSLAGDKLSIPAAVWKVMLILPAASGDDVARVTAQTQVIAVWTPNDATAQGRTWQSYQTTVACVQQLTGLDFFAAVEDTVEAAIEGGPCPNALYLPLIRNGETTPPTMRRVTVAKDVIRLLSDLPAGAGYADLLAMAGEELHRDVRVALLRAFWEHLERPETWPILETASRDPDPAVTAGVIRIPAERVSAETQRRLAALLVSLLAHPAAQVRHDTLARCATLHTAAGGKERTGSPALDLERACGGALVVGAVDDDFEQPIAVEVEHPEYAVCVWRDKIAGLREVVAGELDHGWSAVDSLLNCDKRVVAGGRIGRVLGRQAGRRHHHLVAPIAVKVDLGGARDLHVWLRDVLGS